MIRYPISLLMLGVMVTSSAAASPLTLRDEFVDQQLQASAALPSSQSDVEFETLWAAIPILDPFISTIGVALLGGMQGETADLVSGQAGAESGDGGLGGGGGPP